MDLPLGVEVVRVVFYGSAAPPGGTSSFGGLVAIPGWVELLDWSIYGLLAAKVEMKAMFGVCIIRERSLLDSERQCINRAYQ